MEITLSITREYDCDVLVVGGGVAGISAAISAARSGADVILAEAGGFLGGMATKGLVGPFMTCYDKKGETQIIRGLFSEVVERLVADGGAISYTDCPGSDSRSAYRTVGHIGVTPFDAESLKRVSETMCLESGVKLLYHLTLVAADTEGRRLTRAYFAGVDGITAISARQFIDTTGNASLAHCSGAETFRGDEEGFVQTSSLFFRITGVDKTALDAHMAATPEMRARYYMDEIESARACGEFPCGTRKLRIFEGLDGVWTVNMAQEDEPIDELSPEALTRAEISQRAQIPAIIAFMQKYVPALKNVRLVVTADEIGVRESRRVVGRTIFTGEDIASRTYFADRIAVCANSIDIHQPGKVSYTPIADEGNYYIPLSALISRDRDNLTMAGKCLSADKYAFAAVRVMPPCFAMGEAVGITAAAAAKLGCAAHEVDVKSVQDEIIKRGGYLE